MYRPGGTRTPNPRFWRPVLYQLSYGPLAACCSFFQTASPASYRGHHGQGRNRTADTMIFSHVLYQLSYLAQTKNPPEPGRRGRESSGEGRLTGSPLPPTFAGSTCRRQSRRANVALSSSFLVPERGKRRPRRRFTSNSGGRIRTCDLRVMSPTSYQTAPPRNGPTMVALAPVSVNPKSARACRFPDEGRGSHGNGAQAS